VSPPTVQLPEKAVQAARAVSRLRCRNGDLSLQFFERQCFNVVPAVYKRTTRATVMFASHIYGLKICSLGGADSTRLGREVMSFTC